ncbi:Retrotransposon gag protein [Arachis hypogaea]|nr:Retrotransposon gag protein [Arachis hypogaea]
MLLEWSILCIFYDGLSEFSKMSLDHSAGGSLHLKKMPTEAQELIEMVANNQFMYTSERNPMNNGITQKKGVLEIDTLNAILAQNKILTQQVNMISQNLTGIQATSGSTKEASFEEEAYDPENIAMEEVNYMGESYENTYNPSRRNHQNLSWKDQQKPHQGFNNNNGGRNRFGNSKSFSSSFEQQTENSKQNFSDLAAIVSDLSKTTLSFMTETRSSIRNLEAQVGRLSKRVTEISPSTLPRNTEENPKREC